MGEIISTSTSTDAAGEAVQGLDCLGGEDGLDTASHLQPKAHIGVYILTGERQQMVAGRDALGQLAQQGLSSTVSPG